MDVVAMLKSDNPYFQARAIWVLANMGAQGREETRKLLDHDEPLIRTTAYRALRQVEENILPFAEKLVNDPSGFVRREVAVSLRDLPFADTKALLLRLAQNFDGKDRWYSASFAAACKGHEDVVYQDLLKLFDAETRPADQWDEPLASLVWSIHPASAVTALKIRASSDRLAANERTSALTALAFIQTPQAVRAMVDLSKSNIQGIAEQATYWLSFRQGNDWYTLIDWSKTGIDTEHQRIVAAMKVRMVKILDERLPFDEKKWNVSDMARSAVGGQMLMGMLAEDKLPKDLFPAVEELIFQNPDMSVRMQAGNYFGGRREKIFSIGRNYSVKGQRRRWTKSVRCILRDLPQGKKIRSRYRSGTHDDRRKV